MAVVASSKTATLMKLWEGVLLVSYITEKIKGLWDTIRSWFSSSPAQQSSLVQGTPNVGDIIYRETITRHGRSNYTTQYACRNGEIISGIAVLPKSEIFPSPNAKVVSGGIGKSRVKIELESPSDGEWGCNFIVCGEAQH